MISVNFKSTVGTGSSRIYLFLLLFASAILRLINLDRGLSGDEGALLFYAQSNSFSGIIDKLKGVAIYPPMSALALNSWMRLSDSEIWVRLYFVFFGIGTCYMIYLIASEYINKKYGLIALFIAAISPLLIWTSQYIRSYMDATFWMMLSTLFFLKIVKNKTAPLNYLFYILSSTAAIYTAYFNILILLSQLVFISIFYFRQRKNLIKWFLSMLSIGLLFLPWFFTAVGQYQNATGLKLFWNTKGFRAFGILYLGRYVRQVFALLGMDPDFFNIAITDAGINNCLLCFISLIAFMFFAYFIYIAIKALYKFFPHDLKMVFVFPVLAILPLVLANIAEILYNFRPYAKLLSYNHALLIFIIAFLIYSLYGRKRIFYSAVLVLAVVCFARLPFACQPEADTKKSAAYLRENIKNGEAALMVRNTNHYIEGKDFSYFELQRYLEQDVSTGIFKKFSDSASVILNEIREEYGKIWFYRLYGTDEILGANKLIIDWFKTNGYYLNKVEHFKRIDIMNFEYKEKR